MADTDFDPEELDRQLALERKRKARRRYKQWQASLARIERLKKRLAQLLGNKCALCDKGGKMEVDHVDGRDWVVNAVGWEARVKRYIREIEAGVNIRPLCRSCNAKYKPYRRNRHGR